MIVSESEHDTKTLAGRQELFSALYETAFPRVAKFVSQRHGTFQDAKDIFQDALIIFYEKLSEEKLAVQGPDDAYLLGIAKHLWIRKYNQSLSNVSLNEFEAAIGIPDDFFPTVESNRLITFLERTGKKCMALLQAFYYNKSSMAEIMERFGYGTIHSATVQKFKCLEKIRENVKEKSLRYEDFTE
jgi:DNA-directed RNA polymerase specialized sigma24 family protein